MAERYGWTPAQIDAVDRPRVTRWWAVQKIQREAAEYDRKWRTTQDEFTRNSQLTGLIPEQE